MVMTEAYDATKDPRTGRPIPPQQQAQEQLARAKEETRKLHHEEGIPPVELPAEDSLDEPVDTKPAAMKAPPEGWEGEKPSDETDALEETFEQGEREEDTRPRSYQVSVENPAIAARDYELEASGTVCIEEYCGDDLLCRITVEVTAQANSDLTIAEANPALLDAAIEALSGVCKLDREVLRRSLVS
jgi:hypothetical protein